MKLKDTLERQLQKTPEKKTMKEHLLTAMTIQMSLEHRVIVRRNENKTGQTPWKKCKEYTDTRMRERIHDVRMLKQDV